MRRALILIAAFLFACGGEPTAELVDHDAGAAPVDAGTDAGQPWFNTIDPQEPVNPQTVCQEPDATYVVVSLPIDTSSDPLTLSWWWTGSAQYNANNGQPFWYLTAQRTNGLAAIMLPGGGFSVYEAKVSTPQWTAPDGHVYAPATLSLYGNAGESVQGDCPEIDGGTIPVINSTSQAGPIQ